MVLKHLTGVRHQESVPEYIVRRDILIRYMGLDSSWTLSKSFSFEANVRKGIVGYGVNVYIING